MTERERKKKQGRKNDEIRYGQGNTKDTKEILQPKIESFCNSICHEDKVLILLIDIK